MIEGGHFDAIVVGAGHNGLTAAGYLAKAGRRVLVLERRAIVGGAAVTEEVMPGCRVSSCSYIASMLTPAVIRDLGLAAHGLCMVACDPALSIAASDGGIVSLFADPARTAAGLARFSAKDAEAYLRVDAELKLLARYLQPFFLEAPPHINATGIGRLREVARLAKRFWRMSGPDATALLQFMTGSLAEFLDRHFESAEAKRLFLANNVYGKHGGPYDAGSTLGLLFHLLGGGDHDTQGFSGHVIGGMGAITQAMAAAAKGFSATILTDAAVARIIVKDGAATGVTLDNGRQFSATTILSNADPKRTFLGLVDPDDLDAEFRADVTAIKMAGPAAKLNVVLNAPPAFPGMPADADAARRSVFTFVGDMASAQQCYDTAKFGGIADELWIDCVVPSLVDDTLCPPDRTMMTCFIQYVPFVLREGDWDARREAFGDSLVAQLDRAMPGFAATVLARTVLTPLDLERVYGLTEGNIFHGDLGLGQLFFMRPLPAWSRYTTPIKGLYLCGAGAHPGGGVTGAPGRNAAMAVLGESRR